LPAESSGTRGGDDAELQISKFVAIFCESGILQENGHRSYIGTVKAPNCGLVLAITLALWNNMIAIFPKPLILRVQSAGKIKGFGKMAKVLLS